MSLQPNSLLIGTTAGMVPFTCLVNDNIVQDRLNAGMEQIESYRRQKKNKKRKRASRGAEIEDNSHGHEQEHAKNKEVGAAINTQDGADGEISKKKKARTWTWSKMTEKIMGKEIAQEASDTVEEAKPTKETRIVPKKVGPSWVLPTVHDRETISARKATPEATTAILPPKPKTWSPGISILKSTQKADVALGMDSGNSASDDSEAEFYLRQLNKGKKKSDTPTPAPRKRRMTAGAQPQEDKTQGPSKRRVPSVSFADTGREGPEEDHGGPSLSQAIAEIKDSSTAKIRALFHPEHETTHKSTTATKKFLGVSADHRTSNDRLGENSEGEKYESVPDTWQEKPGKIRGRVDTCADSEMEENIAFSSQYLLTHSEGLTISDVSFRLVNVTRGGSFHVGTSQEAMLQICSVAQGKVKVKMCGKAFVVHAGGMWRVRGIEDCMLESVGAEEVVVHISRFKRQSGC